MRQNGYFGRYGVTYLGKESSRETYWYSRNPYKYGNVLHSASTCGYPLLDQLLMRLAVFCKEPYNSVMCNLYKGGKSTVGWHADDESGTGDNIASLSLGSPRVFSLKRKSSENDTLELLLDSGSLLIMSGLTQKLWLHAVLPENMFSVEERINLTFRIFNPQ